MAFLPRGNAVSVRGSCVGAEDGDRQFRGKGGQGFRHDPEARVLMRRSFGSIGLINGAPRRGTVDRVGPAPGYSVSPWMWCECALRHSLGVERVGEGGFVLEPGKGCSSGNPDAERNRLRRVDGSWGWCFRALPLGSFEPFRSECLVPACAPRRKNSVSDALRPRIRDGLTAGGAGAEHPLGPRGIPRNFKHQPTPSCIVHGR